MGRVYAVVSAKGGVGKTTTTANLAAALAAGGSRVAVVDGDLGMANLADALGVDVGEVTLHDVLAADDGPESGDVDVAAAIHEGPHGLSVVPGSPALDAFSRADPERLAGVLDDLAADHDYVILDTGAGLSNDTVAPLTYVDEVLLVSTPTRDALRDTDKTRRVAERLGVTVAGAALLRADPAAAESDVVVETLDAGVLGTVPDADDVGRASAAGEPLTTFAPESPAAAAFASLAAALTGEHVAAPVVDDDTPSDTAGSPAAGSDDGGGDEVDDGDTDDDGDDEIDDGDIDHGGGGEVDDAEADDDGGDADEDGGNDDIDDEADDEEDAESGDTAEEEDGPTTTDDDEADEAGAAAPDSGSAVDAEAPIVEAVDDPSTPSDSPVEPADPAAVATADEAADDDGVYTTPLEEVPTEEAEAEADPDGSGDGTDSEEGDPTDGPDGDGAESRDGDDPETEASDGDEAEADEDDAGDDSGGGGFFSRFFG